ncbi:MAG TPA: helix-turn-helix domain-containing protein, partial [Kiloniellaceae bacterium]|nr:helix-turn-helix domain-containing protein [Kiloniellaceae bacterium]
MSRRVFLGHKARQLRRDLGLTQLAMAERLGISPSYLNLIEHNRRPMTAGLLRKLAEEFDVESDSFSGRREVRLRDDLMEMLGDPLFRQRSARTADLDELVAAQPDFCRKVLTLYTAYRKDREALMAQSEKLANDPILADSSHRLLTLLTSVHSFGEILRDNADLPDSKRAEFAGILVDESERLTAQIRALFDFLGGGGLGPAQA